MNAHERGLVEYYDRTLNYYSPVSAEALEWFDIQWGVTSSVLDLGCGDGRLLDFIPTVGVEYLGLDASSGRIAEAEGRWAGELFRVADLYDPLPARPAGWSLICLFEVLEHLANPQAVLSAARRALFPGGRLIGSVPINSPGPRHLQMYGTAQNALERLDAKAMHTYGRHVLLEWGSDEPVAPGPGAGPTAVANAHRAPVSPLTDTEVD